MKNMMKGVMKKLQEMVQKTKCRMRDVLVVRKNIMNPRRIGTVALGCYTVFAVNRAVGSWFWHKGYNKEDNLVKKAAKLSIWYYMIHLINYVIGKFFVDAYYVFEDNK